VISVHERFFTRYDTGMAKEIERKFLVINDHWRRDATRSTHYTQGYFTTNASCSIRVRISGEKASLNIKSATLGITRTEYDYPLPLEDAKEMLQHLCTKPLLEKTRYHVHHQDHVWEIDVFSGENEGLIVAEIELKSADEKFSLPDWAGKEVSDDPRYYNVCLVSHPYKDWHEATSDKKLNK
jgi:adenylate cyclase